MKKNLIFVLFALSTIFLLFSCGSVSVATNDIPDPDTGTDEPGVDTPTGLRVQDKSFTTNADQELKINLQTLITNFEVSKKYSYSILSTPNLGLAQLEDEFLTYTPSNSGSDEIKFRVSDGSKESNVGKISIAVTTKSSSGGGGGGSSSLVLLDKSITILEDEVYQFNLETLIQNKIELGIYNFIVVTEPELGDISINNNTLTYTPKKSRTGDDGFVVRAGDGNATSNDAIVSIKIQELSASAPRLQNFTYTIPPNDPAVLDLKLIFLPPHPFANKEYTFKILQQGQLGSGVINGSELTYTPILNALGNDNSMRILVEDDLDQVAETNITITIKP